jgi:hypothetical protein
MNYAIALPDLGEIETWLCERCHLERSRLRNELAFIRGDRAQGGPPREDLAAALKFRLAAIAKRLEAVGACQEGSNARTSVEGITLENRNVDFPCGR